MPPRRTHQPTHVGSPLDNADHPTEEIELVIEHWQHTDRAASTATRIDELARRFAKRLTTTGIGSLRDADVADCESFIWAPTRRGATPAIHTVHLRRTVVRSIYRALRELDPTITDITADLSLPGKPALGTRPLTDDEITLLRTVALSRSRRPWRAATAVALAEATATTGELHQIRWTDLDLDQSTVQLPGADPIAARIGRLTEWGRGVLTQLPDTDGFVIDRKTPFADAHVAQAAMSNLLASLLTEAGFVDPTIKPSSIRLWGARQQLHHDGIEAAAVALGFDSLDRAAAALGHRWQTGRGGSLPTPILGDPATSLGLAAAGRPRLTRPSSDPSSQG